VEEAEEDSVSDDNVMPTGRVVGISQRNWREYVASFAPDEVFILLRFSVSSDEVFSVLFSYNVKSF
jgi:hypothetical protein